MSAERRGARVCMAAERKGKVRGCVSAEGRGGCACLQREGGQGVHVCRGKGGSGCVCLQREEGRVCMSAENGKCAGGFMSEERQCERRELRGKREQIESRREEQRE